MSDRIFCLVKGYHPCSYPPSVAYADGLRERFAVVLETYRPDSDGMVFDAELFLALAGAIVAAIPHDSLVIEMGDGTDFVSLEQLARHYASLGEQESDPPGGMRLTASGVPVCREETEFWANVGGPEPYHDSYTFAFYTHEDRAEEFRRACAGVAAQLGAEVTAFYEEAPEKAPFRRWWERLAALLGIGNGPA